MVPGWKTRPVYPASQNISASWPRLEAAPRLVWRWRGVLEGGLAEASGRLLSTKLDACEERV